MVHCKDMRLSLLLLGCTCRGCEHYQGLAWCADMWTPLHDLSTHTRLVHPCSLSASISTRYFHCKLNIGHPSNLSVSNTVHRICLQQEDNTSSGLCNWCRTSEFEAALRTICRSPPTWIGCAAFWASALSSAASSGHRTRTTRTYWTRNRPTNHMLQWVQTTISKPRLDDQDETAKEAPNNRLQAITNQWTSCNHCNRSEIADQSETTFWELCVNWDLMTLNTKDIYLCMLCLHVNSSNAKAVKTNDLL